MSKIEKLKALCDAAAANKELGIVSDLHGKAAIIELPRLLELIEMMKTALDDAAEEIPYWMSYAGEYLKDKHFDRSTKLVTDALAAYRQFDKGETDV